jgi:DNA-binding NtrC family response regulator
LKLIGRSAPFEAALRTIRKLSACDATVLIRGETGTGKELAARALHYLGARKSAPFVPLNCGAIPETLIESELFGHARGAFTDARESRSGIIAHSDGGTLFLDELEALSPRAQVVLLRFLQDHTYTPIGGNVARTADVRVIASTNVDLETKARRGEYRADLLFRLSVLPLDLPPLRVRAGDPGLLAEHFIAQLSAIYRVAAKPLDAGARAYLDQHDWPGNVRELENLVHRGFVLSDGPSLSFPGIVSDAWTPAERHQSFRAAKADAIVQFERGYLTELLRQSGGNISLAARLSGKERSRLRRLVKKYGLERHCFVQKSA